MKLTELTGNWLKTIGCRKAEKNVCFQVGILVYSQPVFWTFLEQRLKQQSADVSHLCWMRLFSDHSRLLLRQELRYMGGFVPHCCPVQPCFVQGRSRYSTHPEAWRGRRRLRVSPAEVYRAVLWLSQDHEGKEQESCRDTLQLHKQIPGLCLWLTNVYDHKYTSPVHMNTNVNQMI